MFLRSLALVVVVSLVGGVQARAQAKSPVEGVWKVAEVQVTGGANPGTNAKPQPGLYIFTRGHYSIMVINGDTPRTALPQGQGQGRGRGAQATLTDAEKIASYEHWAPFTANSGTYTIQGNMLTTKPLVAKNEGVMQGAPQTREFKIEGSALWLITKPPAGQAGAETRTKLTRLE
jgi:hypothetical protein